MKPIATADVKVGVRHRRDMGDLDSLANSVADLGMLQPIGVTPDSELVFGGRRLEAAKMLGWETIPAVVLDSLADAAAVLKAERDENRCRKEMTPSELVELGKALEEIERAEAKRRQAESGPSEGRGAKPTGSGTGSGTGRGDTRDKIGDALGVSGKTYEQAKTVVESGTPELVEAMDEGKLSVKQAAEVAKLPKAKQAKVAKSDKPKAEAKKQIERAKQEPDPFAEPAREFDPENPPLDPRFMPHAADAVAIAEKLRNWKSRLVALRTDIRKELPDRFSVMAKRIDSGAVDAAITELIETIDKNIPEHACPQCCGTGTDSGVCKFCDGYGVIDRAHHGGLKARWKRTAARLTELADAAGRGVPA